MIYCTKCGRKLDDNAKFCTGCGEKVTDQVRSAQNFKTDTTPPPNPAVVDHKSLQYVYVDKKTGKITHDPRVQTKSEGCLQFVGFALVALSVVIIMAVGAVVLSIYLDRRNGKFDYFSWDVSSVPDTSVSSEVFSDTSSEVTVSSEDVSSEEVSSGPLIPDELLAENLQKRLKGKWSTEVPYKSMNLPCTFEFDGESKCKCSIKAFLFSKKFDGTYSIKDGGACEITLDGLDDYFDKDTVLGDLKFISDDELEFTVGDTIWKLNRTE